MTGLALRMAVRNWRRLSIAALGLALALTLFIYYQVMIVGLTAGAERVGERRLVPGDVMVYASGGLPRAWLEQTRQNPSVSSLLLIGEQKVDTDIGQLSLLQLDVTWPELDLADALVAGRLPTHDGEACLGDRAAAALGLAIGSRVQMTGDGGKAYTITGLLDDTRSIPRSSDSQANALICHQTDPATPNMALVSLAASGSAASSAGRWSRDLRSAGGFAMAPNYSPDGKAPPGLTKSLVQAMSIFLIVAVAVFLGNLQFVNMLGRKKEYDALHVLGLPVDYVVMFPVAEALLAAIGAIPGLVAAWFLVLPRVVPVGARFRAALTPELLVIAIIMGIVVSAIAGGRVGIAIHRSHST